MLRQRWPEAIIIGLDNSPEMLAAAKQTYPSEQWLLADAAAWQADLPFDLVFSNAALQWLPDHETLFPQLLAQVAPAGALAVQLPAHYDSPLHLVTLEVAEVQVGGTSWIAHARHSPITRRPSIIGCSARTRFRSISRKPSITTSWRVPRTLSRGFAAPAYGHFLRH